MQNRWCYGEEGGGWLATKWRHINYYTRHNLCGRGRQSVKLYKKKAIGKGRTFLSRLIFLLLLLLQQKGKIINYNWARCAEKGGGKSERSVEGAERLKSNQWAIRGLRCTMDRENGRKRPEIEVFKNKNCILIIKKVERWPGRTNPLGQGWRRESQKCRWLTVKAA